MAAAVGVTKTHWLLCAAADFASAGDAVQNFFQKTILLSYDVLEAVEEGSCSAEVEGFWQALEAGITANRLVLAGLLDDLKAEGCQRIDDLPGLAVGYPSKVLHIIAHLLDGFIGIDSVFYNLLEDSHWLSEGLRQTILTTPSRFWLVRVDASFVSAATASFIHLPADDS